MRDHFNHEPRHRWARAFLAAGHGGPFGGRFGRGGRDRGDDGDSARRGSGGRVLGRGELPYIVLSLLAEQPRHGYDIIKAIEERLAGLYAPSPGSIYPLLALLEDQGYATVNAEDGKRLYTITDAGRATLAENQALVDALFARIDLHARHAQRANTPEEVVQAMRNLRYAIGVRASRSPWTPETSDRVRDILQRAAIDIAQA